MRKLLGQFLRFGVVGLGGLVIDVAVFNLLRLTILSPDVLHEGPVIAKIISTTLAIGANWIGNRRWTFATSARTRATREGVEFALVSIAGMGIGVLSLWVSHYVLGYTSLLADNIATNVVGLALGAFFRFALYRWWVFSPHREVVTANSGLGATESAVRPAGLAPLHRVQTVSTVEDRAHRND
ncbi:GtrA family protein [Salinibacterium sp. M195]|uniref:GtrA family protein n=1 Tax=Salinibacterium sp. M195 TaxID=2583374 RepID=UPI001C62B2A7|nr:GtrA family protein [Salinibacterium sp. M195]QYH35592.1 GtrA family protein [Salinibacterium sp. M195]